MNREIKFRVWDNFHNGMMELESIDFEKKTLIIRCQCGCEFNLDKVKLLQFTDLKDKNGREIYEGDILKDNQGQNYSVIFTEMAKFDLKVIGLNKLSRSSYLTQIWEAHILQIIGNIYENPELLDNK